MNDMRIMTVLKGNEKYRKYQLLLSNYRAAAFHVGPQSVNYSLQPTEKNAVHSLILGAVTEAHAFMILCATV